MRQCALISRVSAFFFAFLSFPVVPKDNSSSSKPMDRHRATLSVVSASLSVWQPENSGFWLTWVSQSECWLRASACEVLPPLQPLALSGLGKTSCNYFSLGVGKILSLSYFILDVSTEMLRDSFSYFIFWCCTGFNESFLIVDYIRLVLFMFIFLLDMR